MAAAAAAAASALAWHQEAPVPQGHDTRGVGAVRHSAHVACQAKVAHLELPLLAQQQVAGLQIPVEYPAAVQVGHPFQQLHSPWDMSELCWTATSVSKFGASHAGRCCKEV